MPAGLSHEDVCHCTETMHEVASYCFRFSALRSASMIITRSFTPDYSNAPTRHRDLSTSDTQIHSSNMSPSPWGLDKIPSISLPRLDISHVSICTSFNRETGSRLGGCNWMTVRDEWGECCWMVIRGRSGGCCWMTLCRGPRLEGEMGVIRWRWVDDRLELLVEPRELIEKYNRMTMLSY